MMTEFLFVLALTAFLIFLYISLIPDHRLWQMGNKLPGPKALPIVGNSLIFFKCKSILNKLREEATKYGHIYRIWFGSSLYVFLSDPEDMKVILSSSKYISKPDLYKLLNLWLGEGLITSDGETWSNHRKLLTPAFHFNILKDALPIFLKNAEILKEKLTELPEFSELNIRDYMEKCSLDIICESTMGITFNTQTTNNSSYPKAIKILSRSSAKRGSLPLLHYEIIFRNTSYGRQYYKALQEAHAMVRKIIEARRSNLISKCDETLSITDNFTDETRNKPIPFLDLLLASGHFTEEEINYEVQTFLFAGHDTTSTALTFCIYLLAANQGVQDSAATEVRNIISCKTELDSNCFVEMKYLEKVIKEALRLYTPVPLIARKIKEDIRLKSGYLIPADSTILLNLILMHSREDIFPQSGVFNPNRFDDHVTGHTYSYVPFSAGPRNCIGQKYAFLEMKVILAVLLKDYKFMPSEKMQNITVDTEIVIRPSEDIYVSIQKRL